MLTIYISFASIMTVVPLYLSLRHWGLWSSTISLSGNIFNSLNLKKTNLIQVVTILLTSPWDILNLQARSSSSRPTLHRHKRRKNSYLTERAIWGLGFPFKSNPCFFFVLLPWSNLEAASLPRKLRTLLKTSWFESLYKTWKVCHSSWYYRC